MRGDMGRYGANLWFRVMTTPKNKDTHSRGDTAPLVNNGKSGNSGKHAESAVLLESQLNLPTQKIKKARKDLGLTQAQMGAMLECDGETVKKMEYPLNRKTYRRPARRMMRLLDAYLAGYRPPDWPK